MKKAILFASLWMGVAFGIHAQQNYFGLRSDMHLLELSYQHSFADNWRMEWDFGASGIIGESDGNLSLSLTGLGQFRTPLFGNFYGVVGVGPSAKMHCVQMVDDLDNRFLIGAVGQVGIEYDFKKWPLRLSLDARPSIYVDMDGKAHLGCPVGVGISFGAPRAHKDVHDPDMAAYLLVSYVDQPSCPADEAALRR